MSALTALAKLCPPPAFPSLGPDWDTVEADLGITAYGPGQFCGFITLYQPYGSREWADLTGPMPARLRDQIDEVRRAARNPWPLPHDPSHLFSMGVTGNGDYLFWVTRPEDKPEEWKVAVNEALRRPWFTYDGSLTSFLLHVLSGTTQVPIFPGGLLDRGLFFTPASAREPAPESVPPRSASPRLIRAWARDNGYPVEDRGRIPPEITRAWERAAGN
ncbi:histone-like nucleoid-structuring protein Lsr2 [Streptomyces sp. NPDC059989]|uniref:Lsr2 family DNA-binding protein n=1 Tax=Streptomyces sp. NPDC059989 TaxID=3347026 RepID=UPI0036ADA675